MYIKRVKIENFGPISNLDCQLHLNKINYISGEYGSGKTTFMSAIYSALKKDTYICYEEKSKKRANVLLTLKLKNQEIEIEQIYEKCISEFEIRKIKNSLEQLKEFLECNIVIIKNLDTKSVEEIDCAQIKNFLEKYKDKVSNKNLYNNILKRLEFPNKNHLISEGEQNILKILDMLCILQENTIVICDNVLESNGVEITKFILEIMYQMTNNIQFIIMKSNYTKNVIPIEWSNITNLGKPTNEINPVGNYEQKWNKYKTIPKKAESLKNIYYYGDILQEEESKELEYKEIKGNNPIGSIIQNASVYTVAFLNTNKIKQGCIKWGITDDRVVQGVNLSKKQKDEIRKRISEEFIGIKPYLGADDYEINFADVYNKTGRILKDTYIVELKIKVKAQKFLYSTSKEEVYMKTEGGKRKLTTLEIQEETLRRIKNI